MDEISLMELTHAALTALQLDNLKIEQTSDPHRVPAILSATDKSYLTPLMDPAMNDFTSANHFWLALWSGKDVVMVGGARVDDMGTDRATDFWNRSIRRGYQADVRTRNLATPLTNEAIRGRAVYFGDLYTAKAFRGNRERMRCFLALAHATAIMKWSPDVIYGFVREAGIDVGADRLYGFLHAIPRAQLWEIPSSSRRSDEWCVYNRKADFSTALEQMRLRISSGCQL